jgi:RNA polymerase sigma factor (sigma-70 family)
MPDGAIQKCLAEDAEELYNDACAICIHNIVRGRISNLEVKFSTYLITSMRYAWFNKARSQKPKLEKKDLPDHTPNPDKEGIRLNVRKAIANLDPKCKEMMTYRYILGWEDYEDVAKATGKNNGDVVRNLISRCRKRFRELYLQLTKLSGV